MGIATTMPAETGDDLVAAAIVKRDGTRRAGRPTAQQIKDARATAENVRLMTDVQAALADLLALVTAYPDEEVLQQCVARVLDRVQDRRGYAVWLGIDRRFPASRDAFLRALRWVTRVDGVDAAEQFLARRFPEMPAEPQARFLYARALLEMRDAERAQDVFDAIIADPKSTESVLNDVGRVLIARGEFSQAETVAELALGRFGQTEKIQSLIDHVARSRHLIGSQAQDDETGGGARSGGAEQTFRRAFELADRKTMRERPGFLGAIVLINGGLGPGGAERQFTNTALGLHAAAREGREIDGIDVLGPIHVVCRSLHSREGANFFEQEFVNAGLRVHEYEQFEQYGGRPRQSCARSLVPLLPYLPPQTQQGIVRLADTLRYVAPDVVHIWQDGSILATGLAAVLAGVPRIILGVRTMPPQDRRDRDKPEYVAVYKEMLAQPGVSLVSNSRIVAARYANWLGVEPGSLGIIPNGVSVPDIRASEASLALAAPFAQRDENTFVVGSVMRFDENKRPLLWLDAAARVAARHPGARFILVGSGPLLESAVQHAKTLGLGERVIFTGASPDVGYWLSLMDVFLLLSRHEGLPNVLLEAQMAGVPVVTTPAGGAGETLKNGETGTLLKSCDDVNIDDLASALLGWRRDSEARKELASITSEWASDQFSIEQMLASTVRCYIGQ